MTDNPIFRRRCYLRATSNKIKSSNETRFQVNLPAILIEEMNWKINDKLKVDIQKQGLNYSIIIVKE